MPSPTYDLIEEKVLGSAQASVTFSSIPGTYKDLVLEFIGTSSGGTINNHVRLNSDSSNYSSTYLYGTGTSALSGRFSAAGALLDWTGFTTTIVTAFGHIMSYANTNVYKTILGRSALSGSVEATVSTWRSTAAVTSVTLTSASATTYASGTVVRLWGVAG